MKKILLIFGVITLVSGLVLTFFSGAVVPKKRYWYEREMWVMHGRTESTALYYKPKPTSDIQLDVIVMLHNKTGSITVRVIGPEVDESQTLVNWTGCRFTLPPVPSLTGYVDNNTPEDIRVYFIMLYYAKETDTLVCAGLFFTALGIIELVISFTKRSMKHLIPKEVTKPA